MCVSIGNCYQDAGFDYIPHVKNKNSMQLQILSVFLVDLGIIYNTSRKLVCFGIIHGCGTSGWSPSGRHGHGGLSNVQYKGNMLPIHHKASKTNMRSLLM